MDLLALSRYDWLSVGALQQIRATDISVELRLKWTPIFLKASVMSLPQCASFSPLPHINKNKLLAKGVNSSRRPPSKASPASSTAISSTAPSAAFYVPRPHLVANPTLFSSSFLFPPLIFHLVTSTFGSSLRSDRCLPPLPAQQQPRLAKAECLPPTRSGDC